MRNKTVLGLSLVISFFLYPGASFARPLTEAHVTKIINEVKVVDPASGDRDAKLDDVVRGDLALTTGIKSRSELTFQDNTLTRLGPESYFSFKSGTREMTLGKGTMLLQVPKGLGGAKIHTAAVTAAITGTTIMMEYVPNKDIKVLVLEGSLRLSMNGRFGDSLLLTPGKMVIMPPNARRIPDPVTIDLKKVVQTSKLVNMHSKKEKDATADQSSLPSISKIEKEVDQQQTGKDSHKLVDTNLIILGKGTNVVIAPDELLADLTARTNVENTQSNPKPASAVPVSTPGPTPNPAPTPNSNPPPTGAPPAPPPGVYTTDNTTTITTNASSATIKTQGVSYSGVIYKDLVTNGSPSGFIFGGPSVFDNEFDFDNFYVQKFHQSAVFVFDSLQLGGGISFSLTGETNNVAVVGNNGITNIAGTVNLGGINDILFGTKSGSIVLDSGISFTSNVNEKPHLVQFYARGGDLNIASNFNLANSTLQFAAENNAIFTGGTVTSKNLEVTALLSTQFDANANVSELFQLNGGTLELGGAVTAQHSFLYGSSATINGSLGGGDLTADLTGDFLLSGTGSLSGSGKIEIDSGGVAQFDGLVNAPNGNLVVSAVAPAPNTPGIIINNHLTARSFDFELNGDFLLNAAGSLTSSENLKINANGTITLDGPVTANDVTLTGNDVVLNQTVVAQNLKINAVNATIGTAITGHDIDLNPSGNLTLLPSGSLAPSGHLHVNAGGNINFAVPVTAQNDIQLTAGGTIISGDLSSTNGSISITASALQVNNISGINSVTINTPNITPVSGNTVSFLGATVSLPGGAILNGANGTPLIAPTNAFNLAINTGNFTLGAALSLNGGDGDPLATDAGGNGGQLDLTSANNVTINAPIFATTGQNSTIGMTGGAGGTVNITAQNTISLNNKVEVSSDDGNRRTSASGGHINITSAATAGTAINVTSSAQLLALLNAAAPGPGGSIKFTSAGGAINMSGTAQADRGSIEITNNGTVNGQVNLTNATLMADTIKVGALAPNGTLNIGGGTISADTMLKLYAGGSNGTIDFTDNVTLGGNSAKIIAANTVIINNGKIVTILGPSAADVFTNHANYTGFGGNGLSTGTFAGKGAVTHPLSAAPGY